jgi:UDP-N-acetylglucosamine 2-epimerase (non-hydrolysing)
MRTALVVVGTRPEAIKIAPVVTELRRHAPSIATYLCSTGQHKELLDSALALFDLRPDCDLAVMTADQTLAGLTSRLFERLDRVVDEQRPDWLIVQGDTTTAMVGATVGFYRRVPVAHVEAGLRTGDVRQPFPEELNRRIADLCADVCFAPTTAARDNLLREGVAASRVHVTGNTIVDALLDIASRPYDERVGPLSSVSRDARWVLVTAHRRESFGAPLQGVCAAIDRLARAFGDAIRIIVPVHLNPHVKETIRRMLTAPNCVLVEPLDYPDLVHVLKRAALVLTDSGGIQEEAPTFGVPVLVLRDKTDRPEAIDRGVARLVGTDPDTIVGDATAVLNGAMRQSRIANPFGDGAAARRIVDVLLYSATATEG